MFYNDGYMQEREREMEGGALDSKLSLTWTLGMGFYQAVGKREYGFRSGLPSALLFPPPIGHAT